MTSLLAKYAANRLWTFTTFSQEAWAEVNTEIHQTTLLPYAESVTMRQTSEHHYPRTI